MEKAKIGQILDVFRTLEKQLNSALINYNTPNTSDPKEFKKEIQNYQTTVSKVISSLVNISNLPGDKSMYINLNIKDYDKINIEALESRAEGKRDEIRETIKFLSGYLAGKAA